ncbi:MAG TPA: glycosyltransferase family 39 protein, partial [Polyangiales bacterium]|nr:glycosyltransferase family 39 protein [Polyangiales bacterium]
MRLRARLAPYLLEDRWLIGAVSLYAVTQLASIGWDLPCPYGWENDGVAPRDLFGGLAFNLIPGHGHRYPLFHYALLALLSWPIVLIAALGSPSFHFDDLTLRMVSVPVLTAIALIAKLVSVAMSCVLLLALARVVRRTFDRDAGRWAFALAGLNGALAYYGRTSNLDGPYLMWAMLSLDRLLDAIEGAKREDLRAAVIFGALALATKDQAYALYVFAAPLAYWIAPQLRS